MIGPVQPLWHALAVRTAIALREANEKLDRPFPPNLYGACSVATVALAEVLTVHGETPTLVCGTYESQSHVWPVVRRWVVDLTATQFGSEEIVQVVLERQARSYRSRGKMDLQTLSLAYRRQRKRRLIEHHSHPRRNHPLLIETLQHVLGWSVERATKRVRTLVGKSVPDPLWWPKGPPSWALSNAEDPVSLRDFLRGEELEFLEELPPIDRGA